MLSGFFIDRPRLAAVIALVITLGGAFSLIGIPVAQFPNVTPPVVQVQAAYPGASAETVAESVAAPIEARVNGVDNMLYLSSVSSDNGRYQLTVTFEVGTDPDEAQIDVQNRVDLALARLPEPVRAQGVNVSSQSTDILMFVNVFSPEQRYTDLFISNFVDINLSDPLTRVQGVGGVQILGERRYAMRIWLDPERMAGLGIDTSDVVRALESQNAPAAGGAIGAAPTGPDQAQRLTLRLSGRLADVEAFQAVVVRAGESGRTVRLDDIARVELGAESYGSAAALNGNPATSLAISRSPGANALSVASGVRQTLSALSDTFPEGLTYQVVYDSTDYVRATIEQIVITLLLTVAIVTAVTFLFLQNWRATLIPLLTIPVSLVGVFAVLSAFGFSINVLTLFALILAVGLVVDDAIVVVENTQRLIDEEDLSGREAARQAMRQVVRPIIATTLVLLAVFVPVGLIPGVTGALYAEFAFTIAATLLISSIVALTLSPALAGILLRPSGRGWRGPLAWFNSGLGVARGGYGTAVGWIGRRLILLPIMLVLAVGAVWLAYTNVPGSLLPREDQGVIFVDVELPAAAALPRSERAMDEIQGRLTGIDGVTDVVTVAGFSLLSQTNASNIGLAVVVLEPWDQRSGPDQSLNGLLRQVRSQLAQVPQAQANAFAPPAIPGLGQAGGFDMRLQARDGQSPERLAAVMRAFVVAANQQPSIGAAFSTFSADTPQLRLDLQRAQAEAMGVPVVSILQTLASQFGARFVNDFNLNNRVYQVRVQADAQFRNAVDDLDRLFVRNRAGDMVPMAALARPAITFGADAITRFNQFPSAGLNGRPAFGFSTNQAMDGLARTADEVLPAGFGFDWAGLSLQERQVGSLSFLLLIPAILFAFLFLVAQYESWMIPFAVLVAVPIAALGALAALFLAGLELNVYAEIGLILLIALASKNAILIVEFCQRERDRGTEIVQASMTGARRRFRAVLMTAFSFILGVVPLLLATGAGATSRLTLGTTVFGGMLAATVIGILFVPPAYVAIGRLRERDRGRARDGQEAEDEAPS